MRRGATPAVRALVVLGLVLGLAACGSDEPVARPPLPVPSQTVVSSEPPTASPSATPTEESSAESSVTPSSSASEATPTTQSAPSAPSSTPSAAGPVIVIDPGHSGSSIRSTDASTGLHDIDYPNYPEIYETFDISVCVGKGLEADGYRVTLTKKKALDSVGLAARARIANQAHAALAISVHDDHSQGPSFQATYSQRGVKHGGSYHAMYRGRGSRRTVFALPEVARASQRAAETIARERSVTQGRKVRVTEENFTGRAPLEPGNLALVQLLSTVPWVYDEAGARAGSSTTRAMSIATEQAYAKGLLLGVEAAVPLASGTPAQPSAGARQLHSCLVTAAQPGGGRVTRPARYRPAGS